MRHLNSGRKLKRTATHRKALLCNMATSLIVSEKKRIKTTEAKAKELRPFVEGLITRARHAFRNEQSASLPNGHTVDIHNRRIVGRFVKDKAALQELFDAIAPVVAERNGGYTRIVKIGTRRGDGGRLAVIELVDWNLQQDGTVSRKKRAAKRYPATPPPPAVVVAPPAAESSLAESPVIEDAVVVEEPAAEESNGVETANETTIESVAAVETEVAVEETELVSESDAIPQTMESDIVENQGEVSNDPNQEKNDSGEEIQSAE